MQCWSGTSVGTALSKFYHLVERVSRLLSFCSSKYYIMQLYISLSPVLLQFRLLLLTAVMGNPPSSGEEIAENEGSAKGVVVNSGNSGPVINIHIDGDFKVGMDGTLLRNMN